MYTSRCSGLVQGLLKAPSACVTTRTRWNVHGEGEKGAARRPHGQRRETQAHLEQMLGLQEAGIQLGGRQIALAHHEYFR